jgi:type II secretory pathway pseudopilin PulG
MAAARATPEMAQLFSQVKGKSSPIVICAYGAPDAIREASMNGGADAGAVMVVAAIAIPNLLRARMAANESSAVANLRTVNTAEVSYAMSYPQKGYARDLASLGSDPRGAKYISAQHAGLIGGELGSTYCTANASCAKDGYSFALHAVCGAGKCTDYVAFARPLTNSTGTRSFCSTADAVIRVNTGMIITDSLSVAQCRKWAPLE